MRFAWQRKKRSPDQVSPDQSLARRVIFVGYNVVWWFPVVLPFFTSMEFGTGFIAFSVITGARLVANVYRNNALELEQAEVFPLRSP